MLFLCLGYFNQVKMNYLTKKDIEKLMSECKPYMDKLYESNKLIIDVGVESDSKTLKLKNNKIIVGNGQIVDSELKVGAVFIVEGQNMEEAVRHASMHPTVQLSAGEQLGWSIEIHPVYQFFNKGIK